MEEVEAIKKGFENDMKSLKDDQTKYWNKKLF